MALTCANCSNVTETGVRDASGVLCPRCAAGAQNRLPQRRAGAARLDPIDGIMPRRDLDALVDGRETFRSRCEEIEAHTRRLRIVAALVIVLTTPALVYLLWHGMRVFSYAIATLMLLSVGEKLLALFELAGRRRRLELDELEGEGAYRRYRQLREDARNLDPIKQWLLRRQILPRLRSMMEEKLPYLIQRRFEFASYLRAYRLEDLQAQVGDLEQRLAAEADAEIREALQKRLALACARTDHYRTVERRMRLYQIHLDNLEVHMENLVARIVMLDPGEDLRAATESLMRGLTDEVEVLDEAYREVTAAR